jgi:hypothetical protein
MPQPRAHGVRLAIVMFLLMSLLSCTIYGTLVHARIVVPPSVHMQIGTYEVLGDVFPSWPCSARPYCDPSNSEAQATTYDIWLFIHDTALPAEQRSLLLLQLPLKPQASG